MTFIVSTHHGPHGQLIVIVDKNIIGQTFQEDDLELTMKGKFFDGVEKTQDEILPLLKTSRHLHLTGKKIIEIALNLELLDPDRILWVQGIPHAQVFTEG